MKKVELSRMALEVRHEIGLDSCDRLDPYKLAATWGIDIIELTTLEVGDAAITHLGFDRSSAFSGALVPLGTGAVILENNTHDLYRRRSTIAHEMSHLICEHPFQMTLVDEKGCRNHYVTHEKEAAELSGELLIPRDACVQMAFKDLDDEQIAERFGVSVYIARWRMNVTAARRIRDGYRNKVKR